MVTTSGIRRFGATPAWGLPLPRSRRLTWWEGKGRLVAPLVQRPDAPEYTLRVRERKRIEMSIIRLVAGALIALAGGVWTLQGLNLSFAPRSFMTADPLWVVLGLVTTLAGVAVGASAWRRG